MALQERAKEAGRIAHFGYLHNGYSIILVHVCMYLLPRSLPPFRAQWVPVMHSVFGALWAPTTCFGWAR